MWTIATAISLLGAVTFCFLWIRHVVPAEDSADWLTAIATVAALAAATVAAGAALGQLRLLRLDAEERVKDERRAQAKGVYLMTHAPSRSDKSEHGSIVLYNTSTEPIDHIELHVRTPGGNHCLVIGTWLTPTGRSGTAFPKVAEQIADIVRPWQLKEEHDEDGNLKRKWGGHPYEVRMIFRDSAGRYWLRQEGYALKEVVGNESDYLPDTPLD